MVKPNKICVVGLGYVGLPTAVTLAAHGADVLGYDINETSVDFINQGKAPIIEADLDAMLKRVVDQGRLRASTKLSSCDAFLIAVPTPVDDENKPDMSAVFSAGRAIAEVLEVGTLVVLESTSPIGATEELCEIMSKIRPDLTFAHRDNEDADIMVAFCPERILPGRTLYELIHNDRVVGGVNEKSAKRAEEVYRIFCKGEISTTTAKTAEFVKCTENAFRDVNIAFANELSMICARLDLNVDDVIRMANRHPRVDILQPGCGVGGHCIPIDPWFIIDAAPEEARLIRTAREVNLRKASFVAGKIIKYAADHKKTKIAVLGLAYKPDVDDLRESPAVQICKELIDQPQLECFLVEPHVDALPEELARHEGAQHATLDAALDAADFIVVLVAHKLFDGVDEMSLDGKSFIDFSGRD